MTVAAGNLLYAGRIPIPALVASVLWLWLVWFVTSAGIREAGGIRQYLAHRLGRYSKYHFVRVMDVNGKADSISLGYSLFRPDHFYLQISTNAIASIGWSSGQATAMSGSDMNDWCVALWYHHPDGPQRKPFPGARDEEVYIIGPSGPRKLVEAFGRQLVEFLASVGVEFISGKNDQEFNTPSRRMPIERTNEPEPG